MLNPFPSPVVPESLDAFTAVIEENFPHNQLLTAQRRQNRPSSVPQLSRNEIIATNPTLSGRSPARQCFKTKSPFVRNRAHPSSPRQKAFWAPQQYPKRKNTKSENAERSEPDIG
jgi:hypothetical protein